MFGFRLQFLFLLTFSGETLGQEPDAVRVVVPEGGGDAVLPVSIGRNAERLFFDWRKVTRTDRYQCVVSQEDIKHRVSAQIFVYISEKESEDPSSTGTMRIKRRHSKGSPVKRLLLFNKDSDLEGVICFNKGSPVGKLIHFNKGSPLRKLIRFNKGLYS
ncbi:hypothetical protein PBY51_013788 [Eleginops maclovinus]|uniref:Uncharacterized protein n=1 Tax=Eleginops maclovinus TaxID=56733 RepID=A0AAN8AX96_ELEMC|nr:hypothetical protein PBY51_013788 [Eleginops maclovinus]